MVMGRTMGITKKIFAEAEPINSCKNRISAYMRRIVTNFPFPISTCSTACITVSMILLSTITSFTEEARAIIATAGSIDAAPRRMYPSTRRKSLHTACPAINPETKKLTARIGMARPEIARIQAIATSSTPCTQKKSAYTRKIFSWSWGLLSIFPNSSCRFF